jgi:ABC-2 type transport system permease protein
VPSKERIAAIAWKDTLEFLRDKRSIGLMLVSAFLFPLLGLMVTGLKAQQHAKVAILVCDPSKEAHEVAEILASTLQEYGSFNITVSMGAATCGPVADAVATIVIPAGFGANLSTLNNTALLKIYEEIGNPAASDAASIVSTLVDQYSKHVAAMRVAKLAERAGMRLNPETVLNPIRLVSEGVTPSGAPASPEEAQRASIARFLAFSVFFVLNPAALAVADAVSRERESGTGEMLAITPLTGLEFVTGKALGSLAAALVAGGVDLAAAAAYAVLTEFRAVDAGLVFLHAAETVLAILVTMAVTVLATLLIPGQRAATLTTSIVTGTAIMVFFSVLFVDVSSLPVLFRAILYLIPYTHTALAIENYALGDIVATSFHTAVLIAATLASLAAAAYVYKPERLVKR